MKYGPNRWDIFEAACFDVGTAALALSAVGTGASAVGAFTGAQTARRQAKVQAQVIEQQASRDRELNKIEVDRLRRTNAKIRAAGRARRGATGVEASSGSPLLMEEALTREATFEEMLAEAIGETEFTRSTQQAAQVRAEGRSKRRALLLTGGVNTARGASDTIQIGREFGVF